MNTCNINHKEWFAVITQSGTDHVAPATNVRNDQMKSVISLMLSFLIHHEVVCVLILVFSQET